MGGAGNRVDRALSRTAGVRRSRSPESPKTHRFSSSSHVVEGSIPQGLGRDQVRIRLSVGRAQRMARPYRLCTDSVTKGACTALDVVGRTIFLLDVARRCLSRLEARGDALPHREAISPMGQHHPEFN